VPGAVTLDIDKKKLYKYCVKPLAASFDGYSSKANG
jgi:hypothetical protein